MDEIDFKNVISAAELVRLQWRPHGWLLWQMVPQGGITLLAGETASGKSFLGLDLALGVASGRGKAWDMELGEPMADSSWVIGDRKKIAGSSWFVGDRKSLGEGDIHPKCPSSTASCGSLSPLLGEGRQSRGEGKLCTPTTPSSTASGPHLPWLATGSPEGRLSFRRPDSVFESGNDSYGGGLLPPHHEHVRDMRLDQGPALHGTFIPHEARVRYFCTDADPNLIAERVLRLCRGYPNGKKGMGIDVPEALDLDFTAHKFGETINFNWLQKEVVSRGYQLLIFDGLAQYLPGMADGSASAVSTFLRGLRQLTSQTGVSVVLLHQFNKRQAARLNKWGIPTSQGEERVRGSSELLAGVDSVLLLSRPEAMKLGGMGRNVLKVVKNRLGQAGARLQFTIVDGDSSLHLLFERLGAQAQPKPRRLVDAAFDEMMLILMADDERKFNRAELTRLLGDRMHLPSSTMLNEAFSLLGKDERVRVERDETRKKRYSWAVPGTGAMESKVYGLPPAMALDVASSYLLSKARMNLAEQQMERMKDKASSAELLEQLTDLLQRGD